MPENGPAGDEGQRERRLTVAGVREGPGHAEVAFYESARIYRLPRSNAGYAEAVRRLRAAMADGTRLRVRFTAPNSGEIEAVSGGD